MKKEYVLAFLLLMGFGVVSTMAFTVTSTTASIGLFDVSPTTSVVSVESASFTVSGKRTFVADIGIVAASGTPDAILKLQFIDEDGVAYEPESTTALTYKITGTTTNKDEAVLGSAPIGVFATFTSELNGVSSTSGDSFIQIKLVDSAVDIVDDGGAGGQDLASIFIVIEDATGVTAGCTLTV